MSLVLAGRDLLVLDQVNGRLARYDETGRLRGTSDAPTTAQDLAVAKDGTVAMVDRLVGKAVTLVDASGRKVGELPLTARMPEPGLVTAVVIDGKDVYVEKEHGALVLIGTTDGKPAGEAVQLSGRPSKDGALLLTAVSPRRRRAARISTRWIARRRRFGSRARSSSRGRRRGSCSSTATRRERSTSASPRATRAMRTSLASIPATATCSGASSCR